MRQGRRSLVEGSSQVRDYRGGNLANPYVIRVSLQACSRLIALLQAFGCLSILSCPCNYLSSTHAYFNRHVVYSHGHSCFFLVPAVLFPCSCSTASCGSKAAASNHQLSPISSPLQRRTFPWPCFSRSCVYRSFILCNFIDYCPLSLFVTH
jgi:hypothetical protein